MFEIIVPEILRTGFVFGLLPGWWLGTWTRFACVALADDLQALRNYENGVQAYQKPTGMRSLPERDFQVLTSHFSIIMNPLATKRPC